MVLEVTYFGFEEVPVQEKRGDGALSQQVLCDSSHSEYRR
jgi:hypothetical protein